MNKATQTKLNNLFNILVDGPSIQQFSGDRIKMRIDVYLEPTSPRLNRYVTITVKADQSKTEAIKESVRYKRVTGTMLMDKAYQEHMEEVFNVRIVRDSVTPKGFNINTVYGTSTITVSKDQRPDQALTAKLKALGLPI